MAKIKKRRLCWEASGSPQVIGYKLYWAEGGKVDYSSRCATVGNVTEIVLPDDLDGFEPRGEGLVFGLSALDELGNESDIITLDVPYQFNVPKMPKDFWIETMEAYHTGCGHSDPEEHSEPIPLFEQRTVPDDAAGPQATGADSGYAQASLKYIRRRDNN